MERFYVPEGYHSALSIKETQGAIKHVKDYFERQLAKQLNLTRVSAPLFVKPESGLNDNLNGVERPVSFGIKEQNDAVVEIVHSLAKWKRMALKQYGFLRLKVKIYPDCRTYAHKSEIITEAVVNITCCINNKCAVCVCTGCTCPPAALVITVATCTDFACIRCSNCNTM